MKKIILTSALLLSSLNINALNTTTNVQLQLNDSVVQTTDSTNAATTPTLQQVQNANSITVASDTSDAELPSDTNNTNEYESNDERDYTLIKDIMTDVSTGPFVLVILFTLFIFSLPLIIIILLIVLLIVRLRKRNKKVEPQNASSNDYNQSEKTSQNKTEYETNGSSTNKTNEGDACHTAYNPANGTYNTANGANNAANGANNAANGANNAANGANNAANGTNDTANGANKTENIVFNNASNSAKAYVDHNRNTFFGFFIDVLKRSTYPISTINGCAEYWVYDRELFEKGIKKLMWGIGFIAADFVFTGFRMDPFRIIGMVMIIFGVGQLTICRINAFKTLERIEDIDGQDSNNNTAEDQHNAATDSKNAYDNGLHNTEHSSVNSEAEKH